ncbi:uncharacterized protein LOC126687857 [Mercurialis annua]|uniref:uncharacterized protein LOC126687857 n=1 Tax=Mercurialis annua TaxID=3986 RepID=UPI0021607312|nr:uncharacterized protein LOC126687857 [Mercurialis annua]
MATENFTHTLRPFFDGTDYPNWKFRMENYLDMDGVNLWHMVLDGYVAPTQELNGAIIPWPRKDWTKDQVLANALNWKAICVIISSLCREEQGRVQHCTTAHDMWKILENYHEGTVQVKNKKVELLIGEYEGFKNKPNETVTETTNRLFGITTNLKKLGKHYTLGEINVKILRSLPLLDWQPKITAIEESHDIRNLRTDELIGNLLLHEMTYMKEIQELKKSQEEKTKGIALKAKAIESKVEEELNASDEEDDEEMVLLSKKVREWRTGKKSQVQKYEQKGESSNFKRSSNSKQETPTPRRDVTCHGCGKPGHIRPECRQGQRKPFQKDKKGFITTWDDESDYQSDEDCQEEARANLCFMALVDESPSEVSTLPFISWDGVGIEPHDSSSDIVIVKNNPSASCVVNVENVLVDDSLVYEIDDECHDMINELTNKCKSIPKQDVNILLKENETLKSEILSLNSSISRFHKGKESLDNLLDSQRNPTIKFGLGYSHNPSSSSVTTFVKASSPQTSSIEVPPSLVKPKEVNKRYAQAPKTKSFVASKSKSKVGTRPPRHTHASQYSHKWEKRSMKKNHVHSYPYAHSHNNAHAYRSLLCTLLCSLI